MTASSEPHWRLQGSRRFIAIPAVRHSGSVQDLPSHTHVLQPLAGG